MGPRQILSQNTTEVLEGKSWKEIALKWIFNQGVSTVLLAFLLYGAYDAIPRTVTAWISDSKAARVEFREINSETRKEFSETRKEFREDLAALTIAINSLKDAIQGEKRDRQGNGDGS